MRRRHRLRAMLWITLALFGGAPSRAQSVAFTANPPGTLKGNFGVGIPDYNLYAPGMTFPIDAEKTTPNSQVHNPGGQVAGDQCSPGNYDEEWWDTYCEARPGAQRKSICNSGSIHQGIDMRGGTSQTCQDLKHGTKNAVKNVRVVAVYDGVISYIGKFSVTLRTDRGDFKYLHINMDALPYAGQRLPVPIKAGELVGYMNNDFGSDITTFHLHFEHHMAFRNKGTVPVPLYCDLIAAYEKRTGKTASMVGGGPRCGSGDAGLPVAHVPAAAAVPAPLAQSNSSAPKYSSLWTSRGSVFGLIADRDRRAFAVVETSRELAATQVPPGALIFEGRKIGRTFEGKAKAYNVNCPPLEYDVKGPVATNGESVSLSGLMPRLDKPPSCQITQTAPNTMVFALKRDGSPPVPVAELSQPNQIPAPAALTADAPVVLLTGTIPRCSRETCIDRKAFLAGYDRYYQRIQRRPLNPYQVMALTKIMDVWDTTPDLENTNRLAYIIATAWWESDGFIYPVRECDCKTNAGAIACVYRLQQRGIARGHYYRRDAQTGVAYYGRGQTQLTLRENYVRIGENIGLGHLLETDADAALDPETSAKNAVIGLYRGFYRHVRNSPYCSACWLGLKDIPFTSNRDWILAREVLIGTRAAEDVGKHARDIAGLLKPMPLAAFQAEYLQAPPSAVAANFSAPARQNPSDAVPETPPTPVPPLPTVAIVPVQVPAPTAAPAVAPPPTSTPPAPMASPLVNALAKEARDLERASATLQRRAADLARRSEDLATKMEVLAGLQSAAKPSVPAALNPIASVGSDDPNPVGSTEEFKLRLAQLAAPASTTQFQIINKSAEPKLVAPQAATVTAGGLDPAVDFKLRWPPDHKEAGACRLEGEAGSKTGGEAGSKAVGDAGEDELPLRYRATSLLTPASDTGGEKAVSTDSDLVIWAEPRAPEALPTEASAKSVLTARRHWWQLPDEPAVRETGNKIYPLGPEP